MLISRFFCIFEAMLSKNQIKYINSLQHNKYRKQHGEFIAEGNKIVLDLLSSELSIKTIFATAKWLEKNKTRHLDKKINLQEVSHDELKKISSLTTANEVLALIEIPDMKPDIQVLANELVLMLDGIRDPGNLGTIIRTADWFGISSIICSPDCVDVFNHKVVQASMGSVARVKLYYEDLKHFLGSMPPDTKIYGTFMDGEPLCGKELTAKGFVIIGNEANGISPELCSFITDRISVPGFSPIMAESLNAAVACGIVCYAFRRKMG